MWTWLSISPGISVRPPPAIRVTGVPAGAAIADVYRLQRHYTIGGAPAVRLLEGRYGISRRELRLLALPAIHGELSVSALGDLACIDRPRASRGVAVLVEKRLARRTAPGSGARRAKVTLTGSGRRLCDELFPQIAAINARLVGVLDDATVRTLDMALEKLTAAAERLNRETVRDVRADRRAGGSRRVWTPVGEDE
jgi:DNA-binding MarR family transcriptional regulator